MGKLKKKFTLGEEVIWRFRDFDFEEWNKAKCKIIEVHEDHCIAKTQGNQNCYDDMSLWIDKDNENDFIQM